MAYIKYKELTKYFNFKEEIALDALPNYVVDYVNQDEKILEAYKTTKDYGIFTTEKIVLFDSNPVGLHKKIHIIPYISISTSAILFSSNKVELLISFDSGYQLRLIFLNMTPDKKTKIKDVYKLMMTVVQKKFN